MPKDAKLGLVVGLGLVLTIGVVFFRREPASANGSVEPSVTQPAHGTAPESNPPAPAAEPPPAAN